MNLEIALILVQLKKALNQTKNNFSEYVFLWIEPVQDRQELSLKL